MLLTHPSAARVQPAKFSHSDVVSSRWPTFVIACACVIVLVAGLSLIIAGLQ